MFTQGTVVLPLAQLNVPLAVPSPPVTVPAPLPSGSTLAVRFDANEAATVCVPAGHGRMQSGPI